jgi:hypothetical protein
MTHQEIQECLIILPILIFIGFLFIYGIRKMRKDVFNGDEL